MRPVADAAGKSMPDRVYGAVLDVPRMVGFAADRMLPEAPLPYATLAARPARRALAAARLPVA